MKTKSHSLRERGRDAYFSPRPAVLALLYLEAEFIPKAFLEPAVGIGNIAKEFEIHGFDVECADIVDYGYPATHVRDFLKWDIPESVEGVITNPPFRFSQAFTAKSVAACRYVAMLGRIQYLESMVRKEWLTSNPPTRILIPSRRLPMMHRLDWDGAKNSSSACHPWFIWDKGRHSDGLTEITYYDWRDFETDNRTGEPRVVSNARGQADGFEGSPGFDED